MGLARSRIGSETLHGSFKLENKVTGKDAVPSVKGFPSHYAVCVQSEGKAPDPDDRLVMAITPEALWLSLLAGGRSEMQREKLQSHFSHKVPMDSK